MTASTHTAKNVLLILTDQQHADTLSLAHEASAGNPLIQTPNLDRLAASGTRFTQHCTPCALCTPARASIMTGRYPRSHGAWHVGTTLDRNIPTLADIMSAQGFHCGFFGKSHLEPEKTGFADHLDPDQPYYGFQTHALAEDAAHGPWWQWICREHPEYQQAALRTLHEAYQEPPLGKHNGTRALESAYAVDLPEELSHTHWITDQTLQFIDQSVKNDQPFCAVCSYVDPHHPWSPVGKWASLYDPATYRCPTTGMRARRDFGLSNYCFERNLPASEYQRMLALYYGMISHIDANVGRLLDHLAASGISDHTAIIFTSDHGDHVGNRQLIRKSGYLTWDLMNVPLLVRTPGGKAGQVVQQPTQHEDLLPTILELTNLRTEKETQTWQGSSFAATVTTGENVARTFHYLVHDTGRGQHWGISDGQRKLTSFSAMGKQINSSQARRWQYTESSAQQDELGQSLPDVPAEARDLEQALGAWLIRTPEYRAPKPARW